MFIWTVWRNTKWVKSHKNWMGFNFWKKAYLLGKHMATWLSYSKYSCVWDAQERELRQNSEALLSWGIRGRSSRHQSSWKLRGKAQKGRTHGEGNPKYAYELSLILTETWTMKVNVRIQGTQTKQIWRAGKGEQACQLLAACLKGDRTWSLNVNKLKGWGLVNTPTFPLKL